jgi:hypothetical protein
MHRSKEFLLDIRRRHRVLGVSRLRSQTSGQIVLHRDRERTGRSNHTRACRRFVPRIWYVHCNDLQTIVEC